MNLREQLIRLADAYAAHAGIGRKRVSTIVMNGGAKLDAIADGGDLTTGSFERALAWFAGNWPNGHEWPADVLHPDALRSGAVTDQIEAST